MGWKDVPVPRRIARRPRERRGFPVPFVAQSQPEKDGILVRTGTKRDGVLEDIRLVSHTGFQPDKPELQSAAPWILGDMNEERQRICHLEPRCQVCGLQLKRDGPWRFVAGRSYFDANTWFREPPLCDPCAEYAVQVCPALVSGSIKRGDVMVYRVFKREVLLDGVMLNAWGLTDRGVVLTLDRARQAGVKYAAYNVYSKAIEWTAQTKDEFLEERLANAQTGRAA